MVNTGVEVITATANPASAVYGQTIPLLTGSLSGVLPQVAQSVAVVFTTTAVPLSPVGTYPIVATLSGAASSNYTIVMSAASGALQIVPAASVTTEQPLTQNSYAGLPLILSASVRSTTQGTPTGTVTFLDNGMAVATAPLVNGMATATYLSPAAGTHSLVASYGGDSNFLASTSQAVTTAVNVMPDFTMTSSGVVTQTVAAGDVANYGMTVGPQFRSVYRRRGFQCEWVTFWGYGVVLATASSSRVFSRQRDDERADKRSLMDARVEADWVELCSPGCCVRCG